MLQRKWHLEKEDQHCLHLVVTRCLRGSRWPLSCCLSGGMHGKTLSYHSSWHSPPCLLKVVMSLCSYVVILSVAYSLSYSIFILNLHFTCLLAGVAFIYFLFCLLSDCFLTCLFGMLLIYLGVFVAGNYILMRVGQGGRSRCSMHHFVFLSYVINIYDAAKTWYVRFHILPLVSMLLMWHVGKVWSIIGWKLMVICSPTLK